MRQRERRDKMIGVKVTDEELRRVRVLAAEQNKTIGAYVRDLLADATGPKRRTKQYGPPRLHPRRPAMSNPTVR